MFAAYDAIVVGAGPNGLTLALYLQRAGLQTLVVEQADRVGGMARTDEAPASGFKHNSHANYLAYETVSPTERDFDLASGGLRTITPAAQHGMAFSDGRPPLVLHRNDLVARSADSLRAYSAEDADTYAGIKAQVNELGPLMAASLYSAPSRTSVARQIQAAERLYGYGVAALSAKMVVDNLFRANEVRTFFYQLAAETGLMLEEPGSAVGFLTFTLWLVGQWRLPIGGMQAYSNALARVARRAGVEVATGARVRRILVRGGRAASVVVSGHGQVVSRRAIASSAGLAETLLGFLPDKALSPAERASILAYAEQDGPGVGSLALALTVAPDYRSARWDPTINRCFRTVVGYEDAAATVANLRALNAGLLPEPAAALRVNSLWDGSQAPAGFHVAGADVFMPGPSALADETWTAVAESFIAAFVDRLGQYAPNIGRGSAPAGLFTPPRRYDRAIRLREGTSQYRTEVDRLYLCGASTFPGGGVHGACGYNAFTAIAEDLQLARPP